MKLSFHGGAKSVTGSNYLLDLNGTKILVDCGLFQGSRYAEELNYEMFPYDPAEVDYVFLTHSHADHVGRLPKLYKEGFRGRVFATSPAIDLMKEALPNSLGLIKDEAERDGHEPLFYEKDLSGILALTEGFGYGADIELSHGIRARFYDAGHILGSAIVEIQWQDKSQTEMKSIYFSGDLGNPPTPLLNSPFFPTNGDYVVVESAYGARIHEDKARRKDILEDIIEETVKRGGTVIIPSFAMERTQELLYEINQLLHYGRIPDIPVFLDSPLAIKLTEVYRKYRSKFRQSAVRDLNEWGGLFKFRCLALTRTTAESKAINSISDPKIIIAGSGMSMGGRILHHEKRYLPDPKSAIVFIGYQVNGSLGRNILDGAKTVRIYGEDIQVNCQIKAIGGYSSHADQPMLLTWIKGIYKGGNLKKVFVVQGEEESSTILANKIKDNFAVDATVPGKGDEFEL